MALTGAAPAEAEERLDDQPAEQEEYERIVFTDNELPGPASAVATQISNTPIVNQRQQTIDFYNFLANNERNLLELNSDTTARTAIISIPGTNNVKVVYGVSIGASGIGQTLDTDDHLLLLQGDGGGDLGTPRPLTLPLTVLDKTDIATMTEAQFKTALTTQGANFTYPLVARAHITQTQNLMQLAPIPPFLVYDGINQDLNAANILERLLTINTEDTPMYEHLKHFLKSCVSSHHLPNNKPYLPLETLLAPPSASALRWAGTKFGTIFPSLVTQRANEPPNNGFDQAGLAALLAQLLPLQQLALQRQNIGQNRNIQEEKKDDDATTYGRSQQEMAATLTMCGQAPNAHPSLLPQWIRDCAERGMTDSFKLTLIRKHLMATAYFDDADVPVTSTLLKNINKRNWLGKDGNIRRPSLLNATEGLSPFIVLDLDEDEVARINDTEDALTRASAVTMQDISNLRQRLKPKIPATADEFMLLLKRYANLLFALFTADCPFFLCVLRVINALKDYSRVARQAMSKMARASILWIILLQSRTFALGDDTILAEFTTMHANLASKQGHIYHAEVPKALLQNDENPTGTKRKGTQQTPDAIEHEPKKPRSNPNCWHPTLKAKLSGPIQKAGNPSFTSIMQYVDKNPADVIHDKSSWCTPNAFFGRCFLGDKCRRQHKIVTDVQAEKIIQMLSLFIDKPEKLKLKGQSNTT